MFVGGDESVIDFSMFGDGTCLEEFVLNIVTSPLSMPLAPVLLHFTVLQNVRTIDIYLK